MKTRSIFYALVFSSLGLLLTNCSGGKHGEVTAEEHEHDQHTATDSASATSEPKGPQFQVDAAFQQQLSTVFTAYIGLKDAFISADVAKVKSEAQNTAATIAKVDMMKLTGPAHNDWMTFLSPIQASLKDIQNSNDIEAQRKSFSTLSDNLYKSIKAFGLGGKEAYYEFCPMAFNNAGAYWLSEAEQIRNPYFGDKMLTCGSVEEKLN